MSTNSNPKKLPRWLKAVIAAVGGIIAALVALFSLDSCGNSKILLRNASNASITQSGSNIEVVVSTPIKVDSVKVR